MRRLFYTPYPFPTGKRRSCETRATGPACPSCPFALSPCPRALPHAFGDSRCFNSLRVEITECHMVNTTLPPEKKKKKYPPPPHTRSALAPLFLLSCFARLKAYMIKSDTPAMFFSPAAPGAAVHAASRSRRGRGRSALPGQPRRRTATLLPSPPGEGLSGPQPRRSRRGTMLPSLLMMCGAPLQRITPGVTAPHHQPHTQRTVLKMLQGTGQDRALRLKRSPRETLGVCLPGGRRFFCLFK